MASKARAQANLLGSDGKIKATQFGTGSITSDFIDSDFTTSITTNPEFSGTEAARMPIGTTDQRTSAQSGDIRFNSTTFLMEYYDGSGWKSIDTPPSVTLVTYPGNDTAADVNGGQSITLTGDNFATSGIVTVEVNGNSSSSVTVNSTTSITFVSPAGSSGDGQVEVINPSGLSGRSTFSYGNTAPAWNTAADTVLAEIFYNDTVNITSLSAPESSDTITYSLLSGSLPPGLSLNTSTCAITGTFNASITGSTTYTFTLRATDDESQNSDRQFRIIASPNYFGDGSDGDLST